MSKQAPFVSLGEAAGRVVEKLAQTAGFTHKCHCGRWGSYGYGVTLHKGKEGNWYCLTHKPALRIGQ